MLEPSATSSRYRADRFVDRRVIRPEPRAHDLRIGEPRELVEVLLRPERPAVLREEVAEDREQDRLVLRERPVEVEDHRSGWHERVALSSASDPDKVRA